MAVRTLRIDSAAGALGNDPEGWLHDRTACFTPPPCLSAYPRPRAVRLAYALILKSTRRIRPLGKNLAKKRRRHERLLGSAEIIEFQTSKFETERALPPIKALNPASKPTISTPFAGLPR